MRRFTAGFPTPVRNAGDLHLTSAENLRDGRREVMPARQEALKLRTELVRRYWNGGIGQETELEAGASGIRRCLNRRSRPTCAKMHTAICLAKKG